MRVLLFFPDIYSLKDVFIMGFSKNGFQAKSINYVEFFDKRYNYLFHKIYKLPNKFSGPVKRKYLQKLNSGYLNLVKTEKPELVLVYNNQMLMPDTVKEMKKYTKVGFYLGDNPFYTFTNNYNLTMLFYADFIISPDTYWIEQLKSLGINNIFHEIMGYSDALNFPIEKNKDEEEKYGSDAFYIGSLTAHSWGYKRCLFLSKFADFDLKIYGNQSWNSWIEYFPELKDKLVSIDKPISFEMVNKLSNYAKIYPVDSNPGLINGLHIRIFDCIGSGVLPIVEYRKDLDIVFNGLNIPSIKNYREINELAGFYIQNKMERSATLQKLQDHIKTNYLPEISVKRILNKIFK